MAVPDNTDVKSLEFIYNQLLEQLKLAESTRQHLDSKAQTYIGLLSIAVTLLMALGAVNLEYIKGQHLMITSQIKLIFGLYIFIEILFVIAVLFALFSYHTGSQYVYGKEVKLEKLFNWNKVSAEDEIKLIKAITKDIKQVNGIKDARASVFKPPLFNDRIIVTIDSNKLELIIDSTETQVLLFNLGEDRKDEICDRFIVEKEDNQLYVCKRKRPVYIRMDTDWLVKNSNIDIIDVYKKLIPLIGYLCDQNFALNYRKSNFLMFAYYFSLAAVILLPILSISFIYAL